MAFFLEHYIVSHRPGKGGRDLKPISTATMTEMPNDCSSKMIWMHMPTKPLFFSQNKLALFKLQTNIKNNTFHTNMFGHLATPWMFVCIRSRKREKETTYLGKLSITERKESTVTVPGVQLMVHDGNDLFIPNLLFCKTSFDQQHQHQQPKINQDAHTCFCFFFFFLLVRTGWSGSTWCGELPWQPSRTIPPISSISTHLCLWALMLCLCARMNELMNVGIVWIKFCTVWNVWMQGIWMSVVRRKSCPQLLTCSWHNRWWEHQQQAWRQTPTPSSQAQLLWPLASASWTWGTCKSWNQQEDHASSTHSYRYRKSRIVVVSLQQQQQQINNILVMVTDSVETTGKEKKKKMWHTRLFLNLPSNYGILCFVGNSMLWHPLFDLLPLRCLGPGDCTKS